MSIGDNGVKLDSSESSHSIRYAAFISYSHTDEEIANWLHRRIEAYEIPAALATGRKSRRIGKLFRDRVELSASSDLGTEIRKALDASESLIVLCSPRSAGSRYVEEEIRYFKKLGRSARILAAIVDGEPHAAGKPGKDPNEECFPKAIAYKIDRDGNLTTEPELSEPIAADIRPGKDGRENAALKLISGLLNVGLDELIQREKQAEKMRRRRIQLVAASMGLLTICAASAGGVAWWQQQIAEQRKIEADEQRDLAQLSKVEADLQRDIARQNEVIAQQKEQEAQRLADAERAARTEVLDSAIDAAWTNASTHVQRADYITAFKVILDGVRLDSARKQEFDSLLKWIGVATHGATFVHYGRNRIVDAAKSVDGHIVASIDSVGRVSISNLAGSKSWWIDQLKAQSIAANNSTVAVTNESEIILISAESGEELRRLPRSADDHGDATALSPDGSLVVSCSQDAVAYSTSAGEIAWHWRGYLNLNSDSANGDLPLTDCAFVEDGNHLAMHGFEDAAILDAKTGELVSRSRAGSSGLEGPYYELIRNVWTFEPDPVELKFFPFSFCVPDFWPPSGLYGFFSNTNDDGIAPQLSTRSGAALASTAASRPFSVGDYSLGIGPPSDEHNTHCGSGEYWFQSTFTGKDERSDTVILNSLLKSSLLNSIELDMSEIVITEEEAIPIVYGKSRNQRYFAVAGIDGRILVLDIRERPKVIANLLSSSRVGEISVSDDGVFLFLVNAIGFEVWDIARQAKIDAGSGYHCRNYCNGFGPPVVERRSFLLGFDSNGGYGETLVPAPEFWMSTDQVIDLLCSRFFSFTENPAPTECEDVVRGKR